MSPPKYDDINQLVDRAQSSLRRNAEDSPQPGVRKPFIRTGWTGLAWLVAIALWGWHLLPGGPSDAEIGKELSVLIGEARDAVERHTRENKALPDALPDPALALVIGYRVVDASVTPPVYALEGRIGNVSQRWTNASVPGEVR